MRTPTTKSIKTINCEGVEIKNQQVIASKLNYYFVEIVKGNFSAKYRCAASRKSTFY